MPDAALMIVTYGITAALVSAGGKERLGTIRRFRSPLPPAIYDFVTCVRLGREEWRDNQALCSWCQLATLISAATVALTLPEAAKAARSFELRICCCRAPLARRRAPLAR
jgi:hypothetical protein